VRAEGHLEKERGTVNTEDTEEKGKSKRKKEAEGSLEYAIRRATIRRGRENRVATLGMTVCGAGAVRTTANARADRLTRRLHKKEKLKKKPRGSRIRLA